MFKTNFINDLIGQHSLATHEIPEKWNQILKEVDQHLEQVETQKKQVESSYVDGYERMQTVWSLINERENLIKSILDSSEDVIITFNEKAQIIEFNHAAEKMFGISKNEAHGVDIFSVIKGGTLCADLQRHLPVGLDPIAPSYFGVNHERTVTNSHGEEITVSVFTSKVFSDYSVFYHLYFRDLSQIKKAQSELEKSRAHIAFSSKLSSLGEMAGGIAHEINNPLAIIQMRTAQLIEQAKSKKIDETFLLKALSSIDATVGRIAKIVRSLRSFSRDGSTDPAIVTAVSQIIEETFTLCRERFYHHGIDLKFQNIENYNICCRATEISQVLVNLLSNSFDAIIKHSEKWILVEAKSLDGETLFIEITDSGPMIPVEIQEKMMDPFFTTKEVGKATGLGLTISKSLIESNGGRIYVDNKSKNTKFVIEIPLVVEGKVGLLQVG